MLNQRWLSAVWGADFEAVGQLFDVAAVWSAVAEDLATVALADCAHLPHEEQPAQVNRHLLEFLRPWAGDTLAE